MPGFIDLALPSRITKYICSSPTPNLLSVLDHTSLVRKLTALRFGKRYVKAIGLLLTQIKTPPFGGVFICVTAFRPSSDLVCDALQ
jgi:hypothetical protein